MKDTTRESLVDLQANLEHAYKCVAGELAGLTLEKRQRATRALDQFNSMSVYLDELLKPNTSVASKGQQYGGSLAASSSNYDPSW